MLLIELLDVITAIMDSNVYYPQLIETSRRWFPGRH
jgi:hypothetical protein